MLACEHAQSGLLNAPQRMEQHTQETTQRTVENGPKPLLSVQIVHVVCAITLAHNARLPCASLNPLALRGFVCLAGLLHGRWRGAAESVRGCKPGISASTTWSCCAASSDSDIRIDSTRPKSMRACARGNAREPVVGFVPLEKYAGGDIDTNLWWNGKVYPYFYTRPHDQEGRGVWSEVAALQSLLPTIEHAIEQGVVALASSRARSSVNDTDQVKVVKQVRFSKIALGLLLESGNAVLDPALLRSAIEGRQLAVVIMLLAEFGYTPDLDLGDHGYPLHAACKARALDTAAYLLTYGSYAVHLVFGMALGADSINLDCRLFTGPIAACVNCNANTQRGELPMGIASGRDHVAMVVWGFKDKLMR